MTGQHKQINCCTMTHFTSAPAVAPFLCTYTSQPIIRLSFPGKAIACSVLLVFLCCITVAQSPGGVSTNITSWFKANTQTVGNILPNTNNNTAVNEWKSELGNLSVTQGTASKQPLFLANYNATANFNFNPSLQFASSQTKGLINSTSSLDLLGNNGTYFLVLNTTRETGVTSSTCFTHISGGTGARYQAKADYRIQTGISSGYGYVADLDPTTTTYNAAGIPAITYQRSSAIVLTSRSAGPSFRARRNADTTVLASGSNYYPAVSSGIGIGFNSGGGEATSSAMAEIITYDTYLSDADVNKVETYLAVKYGITLGQNNTFTQPVGPTDYTSSGGTVIWSAVANTGYGKCITGIGRDDGSLLLQKQSKSVHDSALVYLYNGNTAGVFPEMNDGNASAISFNSSFLLFGDNGLTTNLTNCVYNSKITSMKRVWKVQKSGRMAGVTLAVDAGSVNALVKNLLVSTDPAFPEGSTTIYPLQTANGKLYTPVTLSSDQYFTFATDSLNVLMTVTQPGCTIKGTAAATVTGSVSPYAYSWNTTPAQTTATATGLSGGSYLLTVTTASGCAASYPVALTPAAGPVITASASQTDICENTTITLNASALSGAVTGYTWMPGSLTGSSITVSPADTTIYSVAAIDANGCTDTAYVTVNAKENPTSSFTITPANVCLGTPQTVTYTGNAPATATYNWFGFAGATVLSGSGQGPYTILFNNTDSTVLQLQVTDNGCTSGITARPDTVFAPVTAAFSMSALELCSGSTLTVTFTGTTANGATATWGWGGGAVQTGSGFGPYTVQYNQTGIISLSVKNGACQSTVSNVITVIAQPEVAFTPDITAGCLPLTVTFTNQSKSGSSYQWSFGDGNTSNSSSPVHTYNATGVYTVTLIASSQNKCFDTLVKTNLVQVKDPPEADFTVTPGVNDPQELHLADFAFSNSSQKANSYKWDFGDGDSSALTNPSHQYHAPGNYSVTLYAINDIGCVDTAVKEYLMVLPDKVLDIPNAFSPNGDGVNDRWEIAGLKNSTDCEVTIFNRWGQKIYSSSRGYASPWDGNYNGKPVPLASYYYVIKTATHTYTGWVALIR